MPSIHCLHDLDSFPGLFFSPEVLGHQKIIGYQIMPFWLIFRHIYLQSLSFPNSLYIVLGKDRNLKFLFEDLRHGYKCRKKERSRKSEKLKSKVVKRAKRFENKFKMKFSAIKSVLTKKSRKQKDRAPPSLVGRIRG